MSPEVKSLRCYVLILLAVVAIALTAFEVSLRIAVPRAKSLTVSQKFVYRVLTSETRDVVVGDSHIGQFRGYAGYTFLGQAGLTPFEMRVALRARFRNRDFGRVMIESGPQMFAADRQRTWSTLPEFSLERQVLPFNLYLLEPEFIALAERPLRRLLPPMAHEPPRLKKSGAAQETRAAIRAYDKLLRAAKRERREFAFSDVPAEVRTVLVRQRLRAQRPVESLRASLAWREFESLVEWLVGEGATVCLIRTPVTPEYERAMYEGPGRKRFLRQQAAVAELAGRLGLRHVEPGDIGFADLPLEDFNNQDHLNRAGFDRYWPAVEKACFPDTGPAANRKTDETEGKTEGRR